MDWDDRKPNSDLSHIQIESQEQPVIAGEGIFWGYSRMAAALDLSKRTVAEITNEPGFPEPLPGGHPRWPSLEVVEWLLNKRKKHLGRPRNPV